ncbi:MULTISPECIES: hypothetical protein [unclassified Neisseria]|uniref:hypothetical protein n=1 Tax=unclassified Neisseria TaxID=2623750 RepID=UPI00107245BA|nr:MULTISPECIES: hypothetical protein [unclassified Neisseria]MBF0803542.1 hypothetical protein [Neisseria sp. 19428wB4_WF04]TFU43818.1 hypothetical protein E4T99_04090 [Neisseria sp. WF04]
MSAYRFQTIVQEGSRAWIKAKAPGRKGIGGCPAIVGGKARSGGLKTGASSAGAGKAGCRSREKNQIHRHPQSRRFQSKRYGCPRAETVRQHASHRTTAKHFTGTRSRPGIGDEASAAGALLGKGLEENTNRLIRRYFPKGTDFSKAVGQTD